MADRLKLSRNTVLNCLKQIYKKFGVNSGEALAVEAMKRGLVQWKARFVENCDSWPSWTAWR